MRKLLRSRRIRLGLRKIDLAWQIFLVGRVRRKPPTSTGYLQDLGSVFWHRSMPRSLLEDRLDLSVQRKDRDQRTHKAGKELLQSCPDATSNLGRHQRSFYTQQRLHLRLQIYRFRSAHF